MESCCLVPIAGSQSSTAPCASSASRTRVLDLLSKQSGDIGWLVGKESLESLAAIWTAQRSSMLSEMNSDDWLSTAHAINRHPGYVTVSRRLAERRMQKAHLQLFVPSIIGPKRFKPLAHLLPTAKAGLPLLKVADQLRKPLKQVQLLATQLSGI